MQPKPLPILENLLMIWEDHMFMRSVIKTLSENWSDFPKRDFPWPQNDSLTNYPLFREYLQNAVTNESDFDKKFYVEDPEDPSAESMDCASGGLFFWVKSSRRVFNISSDLQMLLDATSIDDLTWGEVRLPFQSFLLELANPLTDDQGDSCRYAMIHEIVDASEGKRILIQTIWDRTLTYKAISIQEKLEVKKLIRQRNWFKLTMKLKKFDHQTTKMGTVGANMLTQPLTDDLLINKSFKTMEEDAPWDFAILRIIVGMCMYLKTLPSSSPHVSDWQTLPKTPSIRRNSVSNGASVCSIESSFKLTAEEKVAFANPANKPTPTFGEKCCHFRRGTWCRPSGSDLNAEKTIWRRPTIVRKDKLLPGELPKGAESILFGS